VPQCFGRIKEALWLEPYVSLRQWASRCLSRVSSGSDVTLQGLGQDELGIELDGKKLFEKETFGGNGRTCSTCHSKQTGTLSLDDVQQIIDKADPDKFLIDDALDDDGVGTTRVQAHGTIRMTIPLPPWLSMADDPGATHVTVFRGIPSTRNTPALDPILLYDGRSPTLQDQALGAIHDHNQNTIEPTDSMPSSFTRRRMPTMLSRSHSASIARTRLMPFLCRHSSQR